MQWFGNNFNTDFSLQANPRFKPLLGMLITAPHPSEHQHKGNMKQFGFLILQTKSLIFSSLTNAFWKLLFLHTQLLFVQTCAHFIEINLYLCYTLSILCQDSTSDSRGFSLTPSFRIFWSLTSLVHHYPAPYSEGQYLSLTVIHRGKYINIYLWI